MKTQFESLKSEKFAKTTISPEAMRMVNGGGYAPTGSHDLDGGNKQGDTVTYSCSGADGKSYDKDIKFDDGSYSHEISGTIFDNTKPYWYTTDGRV